MKDRIDSNYKFKQGQFTSQHEASPAFLIQALAFATTTYALPQAIAVLTNQFRCQVGIMINLFSDMPQIWASCCTTTDPPVVFDPDCKYLGTFPSFEDSSSTQAGTKAVEANVTVDGFFYSCPDGTLQRCCQEKTVSLLVFVES